jgi:hypothetical protein
MSTEGNKMTRAEKESDDILERILSGKQISETVKTKRGNFIIKFPLPYDLRRIEVSLAQRLEGMPTEAFTPEQIREFRVYAVLDYVIVEAPEWWNKLSSSEHCPDTEFIAKLYGRYLQLRKKTQKKIGESRFVGDSRKEQSGDEDEIMGNGSLSNITD